MTIRRRFKTFDSLEPNPIQTRVGIRRAEECDLAELYPQLDVALSHQLATLAVLDRSRKHHPDNIWAIRNLRTQKTIGIYAMLMLNKCGHVAIMAGTLDPIDPDIDLLATPDQEIKAIHTWGVYAPGMAAAAIPLVSKFLRKSRFRNLDIYGNGTTDAGRRTMRSLGFHPANGRDEAHLFVYRRLPPNEVF